MSRKGQIILVVILSVLVVLIVVAIATSFYMPQGVKGVESLMPYDMLVTGDYVQDVSLEGFTSSTLQ